MKQNHITIKVPDFQIFLQRKQHLLKTKSTILGGKPTSSFVAPRILVKPKSEFFQRSDSFDSPRLSAYQSPKQKSTSNLFQKPQTPSTQIEEAAANFFKSMLERYQK